MQRRWTLYLAVLSTVLFSMGTMAVAEDKTPDATIRLTEGSVAVGIGWNWGRGELSYQGKTYHVKVDGLSVAEVGITRAEATGNVYNLKNVQDLSGVYAAAGAEGTAGKGVGYSTLRNDKGVVIDIRSETRGANLKIAASGLKLTVEPSQ